MLPSNLAALVLGCYLLLLGSLGGAFVGAQSSAAAAKKAKEALRTTCTTKEACFPWESTPRCTRGGRINLRFMVDVAPENMRIVNGSWLPYVTYAYCPIVDEIQAFNLSAAVRLGALYSASTITVGNVTSKLYIPAARMDAVTYLSVYGFGHFDNRYYPEEANSYAKVGIVYNLTEECPEGSVGVVTFLRLNVTMKNGNFAYYGDFPLPTGTGFVPTCDASHVCQLDETQRCFGERGKGNCGVCIPNTETEALLNSQVNIWTSYFGTDARGKKMISGRNNPLSYKMFTGNGMYTSLKRSYRDAKDGPGVDESDLAPEDSGPVA